MAEVYANLIRRWRKTIEQVPENLREEVKGHSRGGRQRMSRLREFCLKNITEKGERHHGSHLCNPSL